MKPTTDDIEAMLRATLRQRETPVPSDALLHALNSVPSRAHRRVSRNHKTHLTAILSTLFPASTWPGSTSTPAVAAMGVCLLLLFFAFPRNTPQPVPEDDTAQLAELLFEDWDGGY